MRKSLPPVASNISISSLHSLLPFLIHQTNWQFINGSRFSISGDFLYGWPIITSLQATSQLATEGCLSSSNTLPVSGRFQLLIKLPLDPPSSSPSQVFPCLLAYSNWQSINISSHLRPPWDAIQGDLSCRDSPTAASESLDYCDLADSKRKL